MSAAIALLPGDGVGPEVTAAARLVLEAADAAFDIRITFAEWDFGGCAIDRHGDPLPELTWQGCRDADAILLGAVGGPQWEHGTVRPEAGLLGLRQRLGAFANLRPIRLYEGLEARSPLRAERAAGTDMLIVRELTGGLYFGTREEGVERASDSCAYTREEVRRIARMAFEAARGRRGKVTSVDKANVLATGRLWRTAIVELQETEFPDVALDHMLVDAMAMRLVERPTQFDVIVTENMFGDILSDEASAIAGSIGLAPSASLAADHGGLYEPIHGSAPDIAGQGKANPVGAILAGAMLLRHALREEAAAAAVEDAVVAALAEGCATADIGGSAGTMEVAENIASRVAKLG